MNEKIFNVDLTRIDDIVITNARIDNDTEIISLDKNKYIFDLTHSFTLAIGIEQKKIRLIFSCTIKTLEKISEEEVPVNANFDIAFFFTVGNLIELIGPGPKFDSNSDLLISISNIAYSTSRGIIFTRCQGTILKHLILPIMPTHKIIDMFQPEKPQKAVLKMPPKVVQKKSAKK